MTVRWPNVAAVPVLALKIDWAPLPLKMNVAEMVAGSAVLLLVKLPAIEITLPASLVKPGLMPASTTTLKNWFVVR